MITRLPLARLGIKLSPKERRYSRPFGILSATQIIDGLLRIACVAARLARQSGTHDEGPFSAKTHAGDDQIVQVV